MSDPRTVPITPGGDASRGYDVAIGEGVLSELGPRLAEVVAPRRALLVHDDRLPDDAIATARDSLAAAEVRTITEPLAASEANKTIDTVNRLLHVMAEAKLDRTDALVALGGGVVGDIAGFAAAIYRRGIPFVQCPTTLLAMVDASVGGKTGVNLGLRTGLKKNLVGAFWQPALVLADTALLNTLPERHLRAGLAECLKHGLIASSPSGPGERTPGELFEWTNAHLLKIRMGDVERATDLVARNVAVKAAFVADDECETAASSAGGRALLNLGHTFAHAIETVPRLSPDGDPEHAPLIHGEAVALGLVASACAGVQLGTTTPDHAERVRVAVERLGMESRVLGLPSVDALIERMGHDKKVMRGVLRIVVPESPGVARVVEAPARDALEAGWSAIRVGA